MFEILTPYEAQILDLEPFQPYYSKPAGYMTPYTAQQQQSNVSSQHQQGYQQYQQQQQPMHQQQYEQPSQHGAPNIKFVHPQQQQQEGAYYHQR